ncbi:MAG: hypothetical protein AAGA18_10425 [Verrucomicrobiota bacterium]
MKPPKQNPSDKSSDKDPEIQDFLAQHLFLLCMADIYGAYASTLKTDKLGLAISRLTQISSELVNELGIDPQAAKQFIEKRCTDEEQQSINAMEKRFGTRSDTKPYKKILEALDPN